MRLVDDFDGGVLSDEDPGEVEKAGLGSFDGKGGEGGEEGGIEICRMRRDADATRREMEEGAERFSDTLRRTRENSTGRERRKTGTLTSKNMSNKLSEIRSRSERDVRLALADDYDLVLVADAYRKRGN